MAYKLATFDGVTLPDAAMETDIGGEVYAPVLQIPGGYMDYYGTAVTGQQRRLAASVITHTFKVSSTIETTVRALRAKLGRRGLLYREWIGAGTHQMEARLIRITGKQDSNCNWTELTLHFQTLQDVWRAGLGTGGAGTVGVFLDDGWDLDDGVDLDDGLTVETGSNDITLTPTNTGNANIHYGSLNIKAGTSPITYVHVWQNQDGQRIVDWEYTNLIGAGNTLTVHFTNKTVKVNGTNYYRYFNFLPGHKIDDWITIPPGGATVRVVLTSAGTDNQVYLGPYRYAWY